MTSILFPNNAPARTPKLYVTTGILQPYIDATQAPIKRAPWRQIRDIQFTKTVVLTAPSELFEQLPMLNTSNKLPQLRYAKVILNLEDILTGDFLTHYIKIGNILMISEGIPGVDDLYTLCEGVLRLDLCKETYQQAGLPGAVLKNHGGRKHTKERYLVELNLRAPSMIKSKKGFDRLLYAARNVLNQSKLWLFRDLITPNNERSNKGPGEQKETSKNDTNVENNPISKHHPTLVEQLPVTKNLPNTIIPDRISRPKAPTSQSQTTAMTANSPESLFEESPYEIAEWLSLVNMQSPRVQKDDHPDPYISRYTIQSSTNDEDNDSDISREPYVQTVKTLTWTGLSDPQWIISMLVEIIKKMRSFDSKHWLALTVTAHPTASLGQIDGYTILLQPNVEESLDAVATNESNDEGDDAMDVDEQIGTGDKAASHRATRSQRFTCFQFVDS